LFEDNFTRFDLLAVAAWHKPPPPRLRPGIDNGMVHPLGIDSCIIFQTNHLPAIDFAGS
jgi:hypothetical protein